MLGEKIIKKKVCGSVLWRIANGVDLQLTRIALIDVRTSAYHWGLGLCTETAGKHKYRLLSPVALILDHDRLNAQNPVKSPLND